MNILLTGGTGYIGSHCAVALLQAGYRVTLLDNLSNSEPSVVARINTLGQPQQGTTNQAVFIQGDIRDEQLLDRVLAQGDFAAVLHCAGLKAVAESWAEPLNYYQQNVAATLLLIRLMRKHQVPCLLFSSSATVYATAEMTLDEHSHCAPASPYGRSKYFVEQILKDFCAADPALSVILLRYFNPAGAHHSGLLGEAPTGVPNNLLPFVAQVASGERSEIQIFGNDYPTPDGTGVRDYIHVEDVAAGHLLALQQHQAEPGVHLYNLGRGHGYSVLEVIRAFEQSCGRALPYRFVPRRPGDVAMTVACAVKAKQQLGFVAQRDLQQMTDDAWRWQQQLNASQKQSTAVSMTTRTSNDGMPIFMQSEHPHRRLNPLTGDWVLVSPHRTQRPWQGQLEAADVLDLPAYDAHCYLCAGNLRISGERNPDYRTPYVFTNDFAALTPDGPCYQHNDEDMFVLQSVKGTSRVICYSNDHSKTLPELSQLQIVQLIRCWIGQYQQLSAQYRWVQVFENKGAINGCSNPHPHGQIWASNYVPTLPAKADLAQRNYQQQHGKNLLLHYAQAELHKAERVVIQNDHWLVVVPYWASWPFETLLLPLSQVARMEHLNHHQQYALADILQRLTIRYDNLFGCSFPYSMGWHCAPYHEAANPPGERALDSDQRNDQCEYWQLHAHFYPPLLRSATIKKFMVGYEMLAETQRDMTPEQAAALLRSQSEIHYKKQCADAKRVEPICTGTTNE